MQILESQTRKKLISLGAIFIVTLIEKIWILLTVFRDTSMYDAYLAVKLDTAIHAEIILDVFNGKFFYHEAVQSIYSPITPFFLGLIAVPLVKILGLHILHATLIAVSFYSALEAVSVYLLLTKLQQNKIAAALVAIFNPIELMGTLLFGGFSLLLTELCITLMILIHKKITLHEMNKYGWVFIALLSLISASAHRTGAMVQIAMWVTYVVLFIRAHPEYLDKIRDVQTVTYSSFIFVPLSLLFVGRVLGVIMSDVDFRLSTFVTNTIYFLNEAKLFPPLYILPIIGAVLYYKNHKRKIIPQDTQLDTMGLAFLFSAILLFLVPLVYPRLSNRFISSVNMLLLFLILYAGSAIHSLSKQKLAQALSITYWTTLISMTVSMPFIALYAFTSYLADKLSVLIQ